MNGWTILNNIIVLIGLIPCIGLSIHLGATLARRLPAQQRIALEQFAKLAVQQVEQVDESQSNSAKKALAQASMARLFKSFNLPMPPQEAVDIALESAVLELPKTNAPPVTNG